MVLALVFMFVFLFLAALYESWMVPVAVLLSLPVAALGAYLGVWGCGLENDVYFQIGLVMLVGLAAKNAILIVEFAKEQVDKGVDVVQAALHASQLRFRPILMTSLAFILGMLPMVIASGPGSASRQAIGTGVFFGMIFAVTVGTLLTSCQLGKHYTRPDLHLPQQLDTLRQQDTLSIADMQWWEIYTDTTLQSLIEKTLDNNKDMKIAAARVKELAAMKRIDFATLFPQLNRDLGIRLMG